MPAHLTAITDLATLSAACLSALAPGITGAGRATADTDIAAATVTGAADTPTADVADMDTATAVDLPMADVAVIGYGNRGGYGGRSSLCWRRKQRCDDSFNGGGRSLWRWWWRKQRLGAGFNGGGRSYGGGGFSGGSAAQVADSAVVVDAALAVAAVVAASTVVVVAAEAVAVVVAAEAVVVADTGKFNGFNEKARLLRQTGFLCSLHCYPTQAAKDAARMGHPMFWWSSAIAAKS